MTPSKIDIDGEKVGSRYMVYVDDIRILLCRCDVRMLAMMALALLNREEDQSDGWIGKELLYQPSVLTGKYLYTLRKNMLSALSEDYTDWPVWENNKRGGYRLCLDLGGIKLNDRRLRDLGYADLTEQLNARYMARDGKLR